MALELTGATRSQALCNNGIGTYETYGLGEIGAAFEVKPDIERSLEEVRV